MTQVSGVAPGSDVEPDAADAVGVHDDARMRRTIVQRVLRGSAEFERWGRSAPGEAGAVDAELGRATDYLIGLDGDGFTPEKVFGRLRWGGQFIYVSRSPGKVAARCQAFHGRGGFVIERGPASVKPAWLGIPFPFASSVHYFIARKIALVQPGQISDRFTFDVQLIRMKSFGGGYAVLKQVPTWKNVYTRLLERYPEHDQQVLVERAQKLVDRVFPVFLTREYAFLKLLQRDLPPPYNLRVPHPLAVEKDETGMVRKLVMNWLRLRPPGDGAITQLEFARQSADLLRVLHDIVGIIHLDLRLDNFVITDHGVGIVDFGSAVRMDEDLRESPMLRSLFDEMMSTSQIQRMLGKMKRSGQLTASFIAEKHQKVDRAIDVFYLALQMSKPHLNPDLRSLIDYDPGSESARKLALLTDAVLRPKDPGKPRFISAQDILSGIDRISQQLEEKSQRRSRARPARQRVAAVL